MLRPIMLEACLSSLLAQVDIENLEVHCVVVDNNDTPTARPIVEAFSAKSPFLVNYIHEPKRGIPIARNRLVEAALSLQTDWIAFLDDDETAAPNWLNELINAAIIYDADVVQGRVERIFPEPKPFWAVSKPQKRKEGEPMETSPTSNVLFSSWLIEPNGLNLRFDETLRFTGGSDTAFFSAAHEKGAHIVYSNAPTVYEAVLPSRLTFAWQVTRSYRVGGNKAMRYRSRHGLAKAVVSLSPGIALQFGRGFFQLICAPLWLPLNQTRFKRTARQGGSSICSASGKVAAFFSIYAQPYRKIDGF